MNLRNFLFLVAIACSCSTLDRPEPPPAYIRVEEPKIIQDVGDLDSSTIGIKDIWISQNGSLLGAFPIPSTVPYLDLTQTQFSFEGGIYENGLSTSRIPYPFWKPLSVQIAQNALDTFTLKPVFELKDVPEVNIPFEEPFDDDIDFELFGIFNDTASLQFSNSAVFQGTKAGMVQFFNGHRFFQVRSVQSFDFDANSDAYAEITYQSDVEFTVGLVYYNSSGVRQSPIVTLYPSDTWNTAYIHLINDIRVIEGQDPNSLYWLYFYADGENNSRTLFLDNLRVISY